MRARVIIYPREEVLDPQGKAVHQALSRLGFDGVDEVRVGKSFDIDLDAGSATDAEAKVREMCDKLLANKVMEEYEVEVSPGEDGE